MRFLASGPDIPDELLIARDEGRVVIFCGAGVSLAKAGLPSFLSLASEVLNDLEGTGTSDSKRLMEAEMALSISAACGVNYIASLSEKNDQLSQWRAYCPRGGYCLGFRIAALQVLCAEHDLVLAPCNYDERQHEKVAGEIAAAALSAVASMHSSKLVGAVNANGTLATNDFHPVLTKIKDSLAVQAHMWKHPQFYEECEWRIVSRAGIKALGSRRLVVKSHCPIDNGCPLFWIKCSLEPRAVSAGRGGDFQRRTVRVLLRVSKSAARKFHLEISSLLSGSNPTPSANC